MPVRMTCVSLPALVQIPGPGSRVCAQSVPTGDAREDAAGTGSTPQTTHTPLLTLLLYDKPRSASQYADLEVLKAHALDLEEAGKEEVALDEIRKRFEKSL